jgi:hypothetical protein
MRGELRRLHSPDVDLQQYIPEDVEDFGLLIQAMIGPLHREGEESFDFLVCSPRWFAVRLAEHEYRWGQHHLFLKRYDLNLIAMAIEKLCQSIEGPDWETLADRLGRFGRWEFEGYQK